MTHDSPLEGSEHTCHFARPPTLVLPLVSVIIISYNHAGFLREAVASVYAQHYSNIECFIVDNCSTDGTSAVLDDLSVRYPTLRIVRRQTNAGQCIACAEIFPETSGQYIVFLDGDDALLPDFVGAHVYVNLSLYTHVGFTCSDMVQVVGNELVVSTFHSIKSLLAEQKGRTEPALRPLTSATCSSDGLSSVAEEDVLIVDRKHDGWPWTATSAFMFRRDAIAIFIDNPRLKILKMAIDTYFARGINALTGSVVINRPLCIYRMHQTNAFSKHVHLEGLYNHVPGGVFDENLVTRQELIDYWFKNARFLIDKMPRRQDFIDGICVLNDTFPPLKGPGGRGSYAASRLVTHFVHIRRIIGAHRLLRWSWRLRISPFAALLAILRHDRTAEEPQG